MAARRGGAVVFPGGRDLQREGLTGSGGDAGCDGVPSQAAVNLVEVTADVGLRGKRFEAHGAGFSSGCADCPRPTSGNNQKHIFFLKVSSAKRLNFNDIV